MNIVVCVSGGIAAYKTVSLVRLFVEAGHSVHVVPTENALQFVGAVTWEAISGHPVAHDVFSNTSEVLHVRLGQQADAVVIAPATANTMAKLTAGLADDLLGTTALATRAPLIIAPAMHTEMWEHPATQHNVSLLRQRGASIVGPESGRLTGSDSGPGRMSEPQQIFDAVLDAMRPRSNDDDEHLRGSRPAGRSGVETAPGTGSSALADLKIVVSAGGTREPIDPVRFIGNRSSGKQGVAIARAAAALGAQVELVSANIDESVLTKSQLPPSVHIVPVSTTAELQSAMDSTAPRADIVIMTAAVADFRPLKVEELKIRKAELGGASPTIELVENPDILAGLVRRREAGQLIVGFAAETPEDDEHLLRLGREKLRRKGVDLLVVNPVSWSQGFDQANNSVHLLDRSGEVILRAEGTKDEVARALLEAIALLRTRSSSAKG